MFNQWMIYYVEWLYEMGVHFGWIMPRKMMKHKVLFDFHSFRVIIKWTFDGPSRSDVWVADFAL